MMMPSSPVLSMTRFLLLSALLTGAIVFAAPAPTPCGGCHAPVDPKEYADKVTKCVQLINEGKEISATRPLKLVEVDSMTRQVVAGSVYAINLKLRDASGRVYTVKAEMVESLPLPVARFFLRSVVVLLEVGPEAPALDPDCAEECAGCPCKHKDPSKFTVEAGHALTILNANATILRQLRVTGKLTLSKIVAVTSQVVDGMKYDIEMIVYDSAAPTARIFNTKVTIKLLGDKKTLLSASLVQVLPEPPAPSAALKALLSGSKMVPQPTRSTMTASVAISQMSRTSVTGQCTIKGAAGVTGVVLQQGTATTNGQIVTWLLPSLTKTPLSGDFSFTFTINMTAIKVPSGFTSALAFLTSGKAYITVRTDSNVNGAIRGQLLSARRSTL